MKRKDYKRLLAGLLVVLFCLQMLPAFAAEKMKETPVSGVTVIGQSRADKSTSYPVTKMLDGVYTGTSNMWCTANTVTEDAYLTFDLGSSQTITKMLSYSRIHNSTVTADNDAVASRNIKDYDLWISDTAPVYNGLKDGTAPTGLAETPTVSGTLDKCNSTTNTCATIHLPENSTGRYVTVHIKNIYGDTTDTILASATSINISEVEFVALEQREIGKIRFNENGEFRVLILPDLHTYTGGLTADQQKLLKDMIDKEKPDFAILTGDNVRALASKPLSGEAAFRQALDTMVGYLEEKGIYWMHVYGNHDEENTSLDLETQQAIYESYDHCLSSDPVKELNGVGNYMVPLYGSDTTKDEIKFAFWGLDSGNKLTEEELATYFPDGSVTSSYDFIHDDQVNWYKETSAALEAQVGAKVPGLMAFHIPLVEYATAWDNRGNQNIYGDKNDGISASKYDCGLYEAMQERGDIVATACGHDHNNNFMIEYGGIKLCYSGKMSTNGYHDEVGMGARVFVLNEENPEDVETYMSYVQERATIQSGDTHDFETPTEITVGYAGYDATTNVHDTIYEEHLANVGHGGTTGLATCRTAWSSKKVEQNAGVRWKRAEPAMLGDNKYLMVWMDLATSDVDFRKASWGLQVNDSTLYSTITYGAGSEFYYLADGTEEWTTLHLGTDGCFGNGDGCSVKGFKGWFAFSTEDIQNSAGTLYEETMIAGYYFYYSPASADDVNKPFYIDDVMLVEDYKTALEARIEEDSAYANVQDALEVAATGQTVELFTDATEDTVSVYPGITLDLGGKTLTAEYLVGFNGASVMDSANDGTGKLAIGRENLALSKANPQLPVYDEAGGCYLFTRIKNDRFELTATKDGKPKYATSPMFKAYVHSLMNTAAKAEDSGVDVIIRLTWTDSEGQYRGKQDYLYYDGFIAEVMNSYAKTDGTVNYGKLFYGVFVGNEITNGINVTVSTVVKSTAGVEMESAATALFA